MFQYDPYSWDIQDDPYPYYKTLRDEYPAYYVESRDLWVVSRYADCLEALNGPAVWSSASRSRRNSVHLGRRSWPMLPR